MARSKNLAAHDQGHYFHPNRYVYSASIIRNFFNFYICVALRVMAAKKVLSDLRRNAAAIVLQKNVRRYYARQAYKRGVEAALVMQKYARAFYFLI